ncbi:SPOR domain-containing protein [Corynebacterium sp.]|uniref:SPOR domain-containing protein n=1 Tax=Corynebacterium sp. TaxID=1720 RepID=UPI0026DDB22D|nr:SPOR domain-containing protein [Corynebacterium sp.]MDO4609053.1 SPOR domain-containing protein [Corynebacterium sp.]
MSEQKWWYDPENHEVSQGKKQPWTNRMGPYDSEAEARAAMQRVAQRNAAADEWDERDDDWGEGSE